MTPVRWQPARTVAPPAWPVPPITTALARGLACRCPACGKTHLFAGFLRVVPECRHCGAPLGLARADDAPAVFHHPHRRSHRRSAAPHHADPADPPTWELSAIFLPLTLFLSLALLRPIKGAVVAAMLTFNMLKDAPAG